MMLTYPAQISAARLWRRYCPAKYLCLFVILFCVPLARVQYLFDTYTTDNGLPQKSIWAMCQTRDGYLWLATGDGLVRFDGVHSASSIRQALLR